MDDRRRENRLRELAERQGLTLRKSPQSDPDAPENERFQILAPGSNTPVGDDGAGSSDMSLDDVERWLTNDEVTPQARVVSEPGRTRKASKGSETRTEE